MGTESHDDEGQCSPNEEDLRQFGELMIRWGIELPQEPAKPLGIHALMEKWCATGFERPALAVEELRTGRRHTEAAGALFGYCYTTLSPYLFRSTLMECMALCKEEAERFSREDIEGLDQEFRQRLLVSYQRDAISRRGGDSAWAGQATRPRVAARLPRSPFPAVGRRCCRS